MRYATLFKIDSNYAASAASTASSVYSVKPTVGCIVVRMRDATTGKSDIAKDSIRPKTFL